jgi:hypothetical protein
MIDVSGRRGDGDGSADEDEDDLDVDFDVDAIPVPEGHAPAPPAPARVPPPPPPRPRVCRELHALVLSPPCCRGACCIGYSLGLVLPALFACAAGMVFPPRPGMPMPIGMGMMGGMRPPPPPPGPPPRAAVEAARAAAGGGGAAGEGGEGAAKTAPVFSAQAQIRDFRAEVRQFVPVSVRVKRDAPAPIKPRTGVPCRPAPCGSLLAIWPCRIPRPNALLVCDASIAVRPGGVGGSAPGRPAPSTAARAAVNPAPSVGAAAQDDDEYAKFMREMQGLL